MPISEDQLIEQGWIKLDNESQFSYLYPPPQYGQYRPQPYSTPLSYPCWHLEIAVIDNPNGADHAIVAFLYPKE